MADQKYSISWETYQKSICNGLSGLQQRGEFVDMTLAADGHHVKAHQMVMTLVSPYIKDLIASASCPHPVIFLSKVSYQSLESILQYAYTGEVVVSNERIQEFLYACRELHIMGLDGNTIGSDDEITANTPDIEQMEVSNVVGSQVTRVERITHNKLISDNFDDTFDGNSDDDDPISEFDTIEEPASTTKRLHLKREIRDLTDTSLKYTMSNMGRPQIVLNRFLYNLRNPRKNGQSLWRCFNYTHPYLHQRCPAYLVVKLKDNKIVQRSCAHNHPFHDDKIIKRIKNLNMFTTIAEVQHAIDKKKKSLSKDTETIKSSQKIPLPVLVLCD